MRVLLGSGGFRSEQRKDNLRKEMRDFFGDKVSTILFVPYALHDYDAYLTAMRNLGFDGGYQLTGIHEYASPLEAMLEAEAVYVGGGNTYRLINELHEQNLVKPLHDLVCAGLPYMGVSAGANVACPTMMTTNDMPIVHPPSFSSLNLVPYQVNTHFFSGQTWVKDGDGFAEHFGETRAERIQQFHERNELPVIGLHEGAVLRNESGAVSLKFGDATLFRPGLPAKVINSGFDITDALQG